MCLLLERGYCCSSACTCVQRAAERGSETRVVRVEGRWVSSGTVEQRKVTSAGTNAPGPAGRHGEKMDTSAEGFHCPEQVSVTLDIVKCPLCICAKLVNMLLD